MNPDYYDMYDNEIKHLINRFDEEREYLMRKISYLEERCYRLEEYANRSNEEVLHNMNIEVIEKYLRKKKLENLNKDKS